MKQAIIVFTILVGFLRSALPALAGTGRITDGKVNLSVQFTYREADVASWKPLFDQASQLLYNATNGQLQIGKVRLSDCAVSRNDADVWILDGASGAFANVLGLGGEGHIYLSQVHRSTTGPALGQFGLVHEFGHYGLGVYDEYKGVSVPGKNAPFVEQTVKSMPHQFCSAEDDTVACIMDGGTTITPNHLRTEFCSAELGDLATRHNQGVLVDGQFYINAQESLNGQSCWETVAQVAGLAMPTSVDTSDPPGLVPIEWEVVPEIDRIVICIDRSASMGLRPVKLALAKQVADVLVGLLHERKTIEEDGAEITIAGENLAVLSFAGDQSLCVPFREILSEATKDSARDSIETISANVTGDVLVTDLGGGLQAALDLITGAGAVPGCSEAVVLLSDGGGNYGVDPRILVPALRDRGVKVYSVGIGKDVNVDPLAGVADSTGGHFYRVTSAEDVNDVSQALAADVRAAGVLEAFADSTSGQDEAHAILIDGFAEEITFALDWSDGTLDMTLTSPTGDIINVASADQRPDVEADVSGNFLFLRVSHPEFGEWTALVHPVEVPVPIQYSLRASSESRNISLEVTTDRANYSYPAPILLSAHLVADVPVAGAQVTATVHRPGGDTVDITLFDDGQPTHGDTWADDGNYSASFALFTTDGAYTFDVKAVNVNGSGPDPDLPFVEDGPGPPLTVPPFVREATATVLVTGIAATVHADLDLNPHTLNVHNLHGPVTCYLELPAPHTASEIDVESLRLNGITRDASRPTNLGDVDEDGIPDMMVKFSRADLIGTLPDLVVATVPMTGNLLDGQPLLATDEVSIINPGQHAAVSVSPDTLLVGGTATIRWSPSEAHPVSYSGYLSLDGGSTWTDVFHGLPGSTEEYVCPITMGPASEALFLVQFDSPEGVVQQGVSNPVTIVDAPSGIGESTNITAFLGPSPNPLPGKGVLRYSLAAPVKVGFEIFDISGRLVQTLVVDRNSAGQHAVAWDGTDLYGRRVPSGVYLYKFNAGETRSSGRLMVVR